MSQPAAARAIIDCALSAYAIRVEEVEILPAGYGTHLRVRVQAGTGTTYQLRERPPHIPLAAWRLHHELQPPPDAAAPPTVPPLLTTREGACYVTVEERQFELIGWLPGKARGLTEPGQYVALGEAIGKLHRWLFELPAPRHSDRTIATTNDMTWWLGALRKDAPKAAGTEAFCELAAHLLEALPPGPQVAVHGDIHPYNVIWDGQQVSGFCDWEDAHLDAPTFDLAYLLTHATFITWPYRLPSGREAFVREAVDQAASQAFLHAYRDALGRPADTRGFRRALVTSWVATMRLTILRNMIDEATIAQGRRLLDWLADGDILQSWEAILQAP